MTNRRQFLAGLCGGVGLAALPRMARASTPCKYRILDIYLRGALSHLDTLWVEQSSSSAWRQEPELGTIDGTVEGMTSRSFLGAGAQGLPYALHVGACFHPFEGTQLFERMRLVAMHTDVGVHPVATAIKLTSAGVGRPGSVSNGALVESELGFGDLPKAYVIDAQGDPNYVRMATTPTLDAPRRPFVIPMGSNSFISKLDREGVVSDGLVDMYRDRYGQMLQHHGQVRAPAFDTYSDSLDRSIAWSSLHALLKDVELVPEQPHPYLSNNVTQALELAAYLFDNGARHVTVLGGPSAYPNLDTHDTYGYPSAGFAEGDPADYVAHATRHNGVVYGVNRKLRSLFDQGRLPLDKTIISMGSEFGRYADDVNGSEHHVRGYAHALIGGPIAARGVAGHLTFDNNDRSVQVGGFHPSQVNMALNIAAGIDPTRYGASAHATAAGVLGVDPTTLSCEFDLQDLEAP